MHHKNIKYAVRKQLKTQFPNWRRLDRKTKRTLATQVLKEVVAGYDFNQPIMPSKEGLLGIEEQASYKGIISLRKMARFIEMFTSSQVVRISDSRRSVRFFKDDELRYINNLLDNRIINRLLAYQ